MSTSMNGFPVLDYGSSTLHRWNLVDCEREYTLRNGSAGFLLAHFASRFDNKVENLVVGIYDDWGHAMRPIRGQTSGYSNHASGTAIDANATRHPLGLVGTFKLAWQNIKIRAMLRQYKGCIRWGGDYSGRKDEMHFEINRDMAACETVAKRLMKRKLGKRLLAANPGQERVINS